MERDEHGQLLTLEGMSSDDISDEIAAAETRMINLDTALALHETRAEARVSLAMRLGVLRGEVNWFAKEMDRELVKETPDLDRLTRLSAQMREASKERP